MRPVLLQHISSLGVWGSISGIFSLALGAGNLVVPIFILSLILLSVIVLFGPQLIATIWLVGSPTVFGFPNMILRPLPFVTMERLLLAILVGMVFLKFTFDKKESRKFVFLEIVILVFLGYAFISLLINTTAERVSQDGWFFIQYALPMTAFIVSRRIHWSERGLKILLGLLTLAGVFLAVTGILQAFFGIDIFTMNYQSITQGHTGRAYGTFSNSHTYIATLVSFLILALLQYSLYRDVAVRFLLISAMAIIAVGIVLGQTRAPWIGAAITCENY